MAVNPPLLLRSEGWAGRGVGLLLGALCVLGFAPFHFWPITIVGFACLYARLIWAAGATRPFKAGFHSAFWFALGMFGAGTSWIGAAFIERGAAFIPLMFPMIFALAAALAFFWALAGGWFARTKPPGIWAVLGFAAIFFLAEFARGHIFGGFPWNLPGYIFEAGSRPSQIASLVNIYGLSALVLLLSGAAGQAIFYRRKPWPIGFAVVLLGGLYGYGHLRLANPQTGTVEGVNIRLVTVPFDQSDKFDPQKSFDIVNQFIAQSLAPGVESVTHLVWPEGAINGLALENGPLLRAMGRELSEVSEKPPIWLLQSLRLETVPNPRGGDPIDNYYNASAAISFDAQGIPAVTGSADKRRLVPFGEFIPFGKWMEARNVPLISTNLASISPAPVKRLSEFPNLPRVSTQICYEILFPGLTPIDREAPAHLILNQSNDAWFGRSIGPAQHANIARYRAIETGLPIIRSASNGVSAVIDPYGKLHGQLNGKAVSYSDTPLPKALKKNDFTRLVTFSLALLSFLICLISASQSRRNRLRETTKSFET